MLRPALLAVCRFCLLLLLGSLLLALLGLLLDVRRGFVFIRFVNSISRLGAIADLPVDQGLEDNELWAEGSERWVNVEYKKAGSRAAASLHPRHTCLSQSSVKNFSSPSVRSLSVAIAFDQPGALNSGRRFSFWSFIHQGTHMNHFPLIPPVPPFALSARLMRSVKSCRMGSSDGTQCSSAEEGATALPPDRRACSNSRIVWGAYTLSFCTLVKRSTKAYTYCGSGVWRAMRVREVRGKQR
jgi:hypothetical protein